MNLYKCLYFACRGDDMMLVSDYIWSTSKPAESSVGHYWRSLFDYSIIVVRIVELDIVPAQMNAEIQIVN